MHADFFDQRLGQALFLGLVEHASYTAAPLLDESQLPKHPGDHTIAQIRHASAHFFDRHAGHENPGILDLDPVIENRHADR